MGIASSRRVLAHRVPALVALASVVVNAHSDGVVRRSDVLPPDPIEAYWDPLPLDPKLTVQPVLKSRHGDVIIRGRKGEDGRYVVNLSSTDCKQPNGTSIHVITVGRMPEDICKHVEPVKPGEMQSKSYRDGDSLLGRSSGWVLLEFEQQIQGLTHAMGLPNYKPKFDGYWASTATGAAVRFENGHRVVYAPGETVVAAGRTYVIETVMTPDETTQINRDLDLEKIKPLLQESSKESVAEIIERAKREGAEVTVVEPARKPATAAQQPTQSPPENTARREPPTWMHILSWTVLIGIPLGSIYGLYRLAKWLWTRRNNTAASKS